MTVASLRMRKLERLRSSLPLDVHLSLPFLETRGVRVQRLNAQSHLHCTLQQAPISYFYSRIASERPCRTVFRSSLAHVETRSAERSAGEYCIWCLIPLRLRRAAVGHVPSSPLRALLRSLREPYLYFSFFAHLPGRINRLAASVRAVHYIYLSCTSFW